MMRNQVWTMAALLVLAGCSSSGVSTAGVEITRADESTTEAPTAEPDDAPADLTEATTTTSTTEPPSEPESDIPSDEDLVAAATVGGKNFFDLTASDLDAGYSSRCTATLGDLASDLVLAQGLIQSFMGIDEAYLGVDSIEHVGDGSEALVAVSWRDADGNVLGLGDPEPPASWAVEGGRWKYYGDDCLVDPTCDSIVAGTPEDAVGASQCSWDAEPNTIYFVSERTCDDGTAHVQVDRSGGGAWIGIPGGGWTELDSDAFTVENIEALCTE